MNDPDGAVLIRSIQAEPMAAFHDPRLESRHSAFGHNRLYGFAPFPVVQPVQLTSLKQTFRPAASTTLRHSKSTALGYYS